MFNTWELNPAIWAVISWTAIWVTVFTFAHFRASCRFCSATKIQRAWRVHRLRTAIQKRITERAKHAESATKIQRAWRKFVAQRNIDSLSKLSTAFKLYERVWDHYAAKCWSIRDLHTDMDKVIMLVDSISTHGNVEIRTIRGGMIRVITNECGMSTLTTEQAINIITSAWHRYVLLRNLHSLYRIQMLSNECVTNAEDVTRLLEQLDSVPTYGNPQIRTERRMVSVRKNQSC